MFTPTKLIILGLILFVVWTIFKMIEKRNAVAQDKKDEAKKGAAIDLQECAACGAWVDAPCGKENCPIKS